MPTKLPGKNCLLYRCKNKDEFAKSMPPFDEWGPRPIGLEGPGENLVVVVPFLAPGDELAPSDGVGGKASAEAGGSSAEEQVLSRGPGASSSGACHPLLRHRLLRRRSMRLPRPRLQEPREVVVKRCPAVCCNRAPWRYSPGLFFGPAARRPSRPALRSSLRGLRGAPQEERIPQR